MRAGPVVNPAPGQVGWGRCSKCQGMWFGDNSGSKCPAGGGHTKQGSGIYKILA